MYSKDELKNLKLEFWESFAAFCEVQPYLRGRKKIWTLYDTKVKGVELKFDATREGAFVILEVNHRGEEARLEMFERLTWYKDTLETDFPEGLTWDICFVRDTGKQVADLTFYMNDTGHASGENTRKEGERKCPYRGNSFYDQSRGQRCAQRESSVNRQIREVQDLVGDVNAQGHDRVDQPFLKDS